MSGLKVVTFEKFKEQKEVSNLVYDNKFWEPQLRPSLLTDAIGAS